MPDNWKRPKVLPEITSHIETQCGTLHFIMAMEDEKIVECRAMIGKSGTCCNMQLENFCKIISMYLQSPEPRYKIVKKFRKQFIPVNCGQPFLWEEKKYLSCHDLIAQWVVKELEKQIV